MLRKIANYIFENNLKQIRQNQEIPLAVLAERIGVSRQALNAIENQHAYPTLITAYKLAWYFHKNIEDIFYFYVNEVQDPEPQENFL